jgi:hypothetical protein
VGSPFRGFHTFLDSFSIVRSIDRLIVATFDALKASTTNMKGVLFDERKTIAGSKREKVRFGLVLLDKQNPRGRTFAH